MAATLNQDLIMNQPIWIVFTLIFCGLGFFHMFRACMHIEKLPHVKGFSSINGVSSGLNELNDTFDHYIGELNRINRVADIAAGLGYFIAAFTAGYSFYIS